MGLKAATFLLFALATISIATSYELAQVWNGDKQSDVEAPIHKIVKRETDIDQFTYDTRKRFGSHKKYKKNKYESMETKEEKEDNDLESIVISIKTPERNEQGNSMGGILRKIFKYIKSFIMDRSLRFSWKLKQYYIYPKIVSFKSGKPSMLYQINVNEVVDSIKKHLSTNMFSKRSEDVIRKAAILFRRFKDQILNNRN